MSRHHPILVEEFRILSRRSLMLSILRTGPILAYVTGLVNKMMVEFMPSTIEDYRTMMCAFSMPARHLDAYGHLLEVVDVVCDRRLSIFNGNPIPDLLSMLKLNILFWNTCGVGSANFLATLRDLIRTQDPRIIALVETHISGARADEVCRQIGFNGMRKMETSGFAEGIRLLWRMLVVSVLPLRLHPQHITVEIKRRGEVPWVLSAIYGSPNASTRLNLWCELEDFALSNNRSWILTGDFNATRSTSEKSRQSDSTQRAFEIFDQWIDNLHLVDLGFIGPKYTWWCGSDPSTRIAARLDRALCNVDWRLHFPEALVHHLTATHSDHASILICVDCPKAPPAQSRPFQFHASWLMHDDFRTFLERSWQPQP
ncbi:hypothetical protein V2J09_012006 [Rumex salicifolius]